MQDAIDAQVNVLAHRLTSVTDGARRRMVALAGPPGAGKSTLAEALAAHLTAAGSPAAVMPMDGFHLDDSVLRARGLLARKGAPETFDAAGFIHAVRRVRTEPEVILPVFDRRREIAIAGVQVIGPETQVVVVEGNYLCLDEDPWSALAQDWDLSVFLDVPLPELERRLIARWQGFGFAADGAREKAMGNDIPNARRVLGARGAVDMVLNG